MLQNRDLILLLTDMEEKHNHEQEASELLNKIVDKVDIDYEALKFINNNRKMDITAFYTKIRKSYNHKKSKLYINLVKDISSINVPEMLTTLSSFLLQVNLFSKEVEDKRMFFKHSRAEEVSRVLNKYYSDLDVSSLLKMLRIIKCDILAFNTLNDEKLMLN